MKKILVVALFVALGPALFGGVTCETGGWGKTPIIRSSNGLVMNHPFNAVVQSYQKVWVTVGDTTNHLTQVDVRISSGGKILCSSLVPVHQPWKSTTFSAPAFGGYVEFEVSVDTGGQDVAHLPVSVYTTPANISGEWTTTKPKRGLFTISQNGLSITFQRHPDSELRAKGSAFYAHVRGTFEEANRIKVLGFVGCSPCIGTLSPNADRINWSNGRLWSH